jgi:hypothetical protein
MDTNKSQIHDRLLSWLGTGTSIKCCAVKLVLCGIVAYHQVSILSAMSCREQVTLLNRVNNLK